MGAVVGTAAVVVIGRGVVATVVVIGRGVVATVVTGGAVAIERTGCGGAGAVGAEAKSGTSETMVLAGVEDTLEGDSAKARVGAVVGAAVVVVTGRGVVAVVATSGGVACAR